jgi:predicted oxidoreductase (fatty acid repression mutant protein)
LAKKRTIYELKPDGVLPKVKHTIQDIVYHTPKDFFFGEYHTSKEIILTNESS